MPDIEIKRGYEVLPDNNVRFGIRVINNSDFIISDVEVIFDYNESLFKLEGNKIQNLGTIPPTVPRTAKFILKPLGCIHKEEIGATILYKDHQWKKHTEEMRPKEVHCVCPFLKEKAMTQAQFFNLTKSGYAAEQGVNFENIDVERMASLLTQTCRNRLYKVSEYTIENGLILYLASESIGEKAYYLLTAAIKEYEGLTQIMLRANSDKSYGLNGFLNEILDNLRHVVETIQSAREIGIIKKEQVINIIDSVVQRTTFAGEGAASVNIRGSVVQHTEIKGDEERKRREEERARREKEEQERVRREREEEESAQREILERVHREEERSEKERKSKEEKDRIAREDTERREKEKNKIRQEEEHLRGQRKEQERIAREREDSRLKATLPGMRFKKQGNIESGEHPPTTYSIRKMEHNDKDPSPKKPFAVLMIFGVLLLGLWLFTDSPVEPGDEPIMGPDENSTTLFQSPQVTQTITQLPVITPPMTTPSETTLTSNQSTFTNSIGMEFVLIPEGEFDMGWSDSWLENYTGPTEPVHRVKLAKAFYIGKYEVTQKQWYDIMKNNPSSSKGDNLPVEQVSWIDVREFIVKLNEKEGSNKYRLPSEAEWEYAARAGTTTWYSFGDDRSKAGDYAWYRDNSGSKSHEVGQKKPNPWGLYDMHGNVWEWVQDKWHDNYNGAPTDGSAWERDGKIPFYRGCGIYSDAAECGSAYRYNYEWVVFSDQIGFRLVRDL